MSSGGFGRFEDIDAWKRARELTRAVYVVTRGEEFRRDFGLASQVQRASVSVMANIAEGFERYRRAEFRQYVSVAKASCAEVRSHLYVAHDIGYLTDQEFEQLMARAHEVARLLSALLRSLSDSQH